MMHETREFPVSQMACGIYIVFANNLLKGNSLQESLVEAKEACLNYYSREPYRQELFRFSRVLTERMTCCPRKK